jgi:C4-dicarboxylate-specific signal transduction histidine kinase
MLNDTRTDAMATVARREALTSTHHHTALVRGDHLAVVVALGAFLWLFGIVFVVSWRHSGDRLRGILSEFHDDTPRAEQEYEVNARTADLR